MKANLPVWSYYPKEDLNYTDPLYVPYQKDDVETPNGICKVNTWQKTGSKSMVHPELIRRGWGHTFQLMYPDVDPCPVGFSKDNEGFCHPETPEFEGTFYTKDAFVPRWQYFGGYTVQRGHEKKPEISEFDLKSVNPWSGKFVVYHKAKQGISNKKYNTMPSKYSFIA